MDERDNSFWCLLPHEILGLIIQLIDFIDFHCMSAVCNNWRLACKHSSPPIPNDPIPWLLTKKTLPTRFDIRIHRPLTNKTYKIDLPELAGTCLYSKDGWLLMYTYHSRHHLQSFLLLNLFTLNKICLPLPNLGFVSPSINMGTFSTTPSKSPFCVIFLVRNIETRTYVLYAWKIGGSNTWKTFHLRQLDLLKDSLYNTWLCDDYLYCFFLDSLMVFDYDLNLKTSKELDFFNDHTFTKTESNKELFAVAWDTTDTYKFDKSTLDWVKVNVKILIGFKRRDTYNIGFMVRDQWNEVYIQMMNLKNYGCHWATKGEHVMVDIDHMNPAWLHLS